MRTEREWVRWCDEHPVRAGLMQLGIYALCWMAFLVVFGLAGFVCASGHL